MGTPARNLATLAAPVRAEPAPERARWEFRVHEGREQARCVAAPRAPWQREEQTEPGPWFDLPAHNPAPYFDARELALASLGDPMRKYEEHASYPVNIELPLCGLCGAVMARCGHHEGFRLDEGERFETLTPERRAELAARVEEWTKSREDFWRGAR